MPRRDGRKANELRPVKFTRRFTRHAGGSVLITAGQTKVLCTACFEPGVPLWRKDTGSGWLTAEYAMLPSSTPQRRRRGERIDGRSQEIQRLVGRCLRAVVDLDLLGENTIWIDCDVLQADGGTRTAAVTGSYVALVDCVADALKKNLLQADPITGQVAAVSAGIVNGRVLLDLDYEEDSTADADFNIVMTAEGKFVEVQGTAEHGDFDADQLNKILTAAGKGIRKLLQLQRQALRR